MGPELVPGPNEPKTSFDWFGHSDHDEDKDYNEISDTATNLGWTHVTKDGFLIVGNKRLGNMSNKKRTLDKFYTYVAKQVLKKE